MSLIIVLAVFGWFSPSTCVCVFDSVWLYFQYVSEWFDSVFSVSTLSIPLHKLVKTVAFFTVLNEKKHKISYSEFKRNISNLINPFREKANFQATSLSSFCKFAEQSFNVILSKTCTPCLSHAQSVSSIQRCQWAEKWPLLSLMLLHHGITSGWAPVRIFTGLLLISLSARFRGHIDFYTALSQGRAEDSRQHIPAFRCSSYTRKQSSHCFLLRIASALCERVCLCILTTSQTEWVCQFVLSWLASSEHSNAPLIITLAALNVFYDKIGEQLVIFVYSFLCLISLLVCIHTHNVQTLKYDFLQNWIIMVHLGGGFRGKKFRVTLICPSRGVTTIMDQNKVELIGPEALHLVDDMLTAAWNTNQGAMLLWFNITNPDHISYCL